MYLILGQVIWAPLAFADNSAPRTATISTLALSSGSGMPVYAAKLLFLSTVSPASPGSGSMPTGMVTFTLDGILTIASQPINLAGIASISPVLTVGTHSIVAALENSPGQFTASSDPLSITIKTTRSRHLLK